MNIQESSNNYINPLNTNISSTSSFLDQRMDYRIEKMDDLLNQANEIDQDNSLSYGQKLEKIAFLYRDAGIEAGAMIVDLRSAITSSDSPPNIEKINQVQGSYDQIRALLINLERERKMEKFPADHTINQMKELANQADQIGEDASLTPEQKLEKVAFLYREAGIEMQGMIEDIKRSVFPPNTESIEEVKESYYHILQLLKKLEGEKNQEPSFPLIQPLET